MAEHFACVILTTCNGGASENSKEQEDQTHRLVVLRRPLGSVRPAAAPDVELAVVVQLWNRPADDGQEHHLGDVSFGSHGDILDGL